MSLLVTLVLLGLTVGSLYALFAVSFGVIYNVTHIFHLAHGAVIGAAGYLIFFLVSRLGWPVWLGIVVAVPVAAAIGAAIELGFYRPLRRRNAPHVAFFLTSVGILIVAEGLFGTIFGPGGITYSFLPLASVPLGPTSMPNANLAMLSGWAFVAPAVAVRARHPHRTLHARRRRHAGRCRFRWDRHRTHVPHRLSARLRADGSRRRALCLGAGAYRRSADSTSCSWHRRR